MAAKKKIIKKRTEIKPKAKNARELSETGSVKHKKYWEYYSLVIFLIFCVLFISILIIAVFAVFGRHGVWLVIPITVILWGISYALAKIFFKKKPEKK